GGTFTSDSKKKVLLVGDSFAQDFANMAHEAGAWDGAQIRTVYVPAACQMADVAEDVSEHIASVDWPICAKFPNIQSSASLIGQAEIVVLAAQWKLWSARLLPQTISNMGLRANQQLFVIGLKRFPPVNIRNLLDGGDAGRAAFRYRITEDVSKINPLLATSLPSGFFLDHIHIV